VFDCFDPVIDLGPTCARIARDPRLLEAVGTLYGEPAHLFKDKLIFKTPGAQGYGLHQDYISWPSFPTSFLTAIVAIDRADATNGATEVFPGHHARGCMTPRDGMYHELAAGQVDLTRGVMLDLKPGDVALFSGYTPHRSAPNTSATPRRLLYLSYNARSDGGERREAHYAEFHRWLQERYAEYGKVNTFFR
jgi:ectoine hydroxylase-related dioxygenase (phytanoyl-CoA dioxygenase family)